MGRDAGILLTTKGYTVYLFFKAICNMSLAP